MCEDITTTEDTTATLQSSTSPSASLINSITTPLSLLITAWLLDMIDSCSIEKLPIYSSVTHFLSFRFRGRLEDTSICWGCPGVPVHEGIPFVFITIHGVMTHSLMFPSFVCRYTRTQPICCSHNKAYVEFIRNNKPVNTSFVDRSTHPVYLIVLPLWIRELLRAEVAVLAHETGVLYR